MKVRSGVKMIFEFVGRTALGTYILFCPLKVSICALRAVHVGWAFAAQASLVA